MDLLQIFFEKSPHLIHKYHSVWPSFSAEAPWSFVSLSGFFLLVPHFWRDRYYKGLGISPKNRFVVVTCSLHLIPLLEIILSHHTSSSISLALVSFQIYCSRLPDGFDIRKFLWVFLKDGHISYCLVADKYGGGGPPKIKRLVDHPWLNPPPPFFTKKVHLWYHFKNGAYLWHLVHLN